MKLVIADSALKDLQEIKDWYLEQGVPEIGRAFVESTLEQTQHLTTNPDMGRIVPEFNQENIRELIRPPFRIVYLRQSTTLGVIRVWRSERILDLPASDGT